ncbi:hypothetical protein [Marinobacter sp. Arc7-DN-1]|uniref:hypothetical protein n=1 Tax=Marinobacter sp. Arc7-DN-1 TaxID=2304594 RepID=UPI000E43D936|nr:hypothetical protein [Marinobacter sp. Arc7-DN-1]AXS83580.1 hypothetical protein D0851_11340 [Marinobacter sp. Arc7-DN-1]
MSKEKERKIFQLIGLCVVFLIMLVVLLILVLGGYLSGDISAFGRRYNGSRELSEDPAGFWYSVLAWGGFLLVFVSVSVREIVKRVKEIRNS